MSRRVLLLTLLIALAAPRGLAAQTTPVIPDVALQDQDGRSVRVYTDVLKGRIVVMNFIFTSCTTICSPMGANFGALQARLGPGTDVALVSVSLDPLTDTPSRLKLWSERFGARPGWTLLTGPKDEIDRLLVALRVFSPDRFAHSPIVLIGNEATGQWTRANGLLPPSKLVTLIADLRAAPGTAAAKREGR